MSHIIQPSRDTLALLAAIQGALLGNVPTQKRLAQESTLAALNDKVTNGLAPTSDAISVVLAEDSNQDFFGNFKTSQLTPNVNLKSIYGLSELRDRVVTTGAGVVQGAFTTGTGEYRLATTANGADSATLFSAERGRYQAGFSAVTGLGVRVPALPTGDQIMFWGLGDSPLLPNANGLFFGVDATDVFVSIFRDGVETRVPRTAWNGDRLDGTGPSGLTLDLSDGNVFQIEFTWYGYGPVSFVLIDQRSPASISSPLRVHTLRQEGSTSITDPNLPLCVAVDNGGTAAATEVFLGGRQYSIQGRVNTPQRQTSERLIGATVAGTVIPLISFQRKVAYSSASLKLAEFEVISDTELVVEVRFNPSLTGAAFGTPTNTLAAETAVESDTTATALTGGVLVTSTLVAANTRQSQSVARSVLPANDVPEGATPGIVTLAAVAPGGGPATVSAIFKITEEW